MSFELLRAYLACGVPTATRLLAIRKTARPLPAPLRRTVRIACVSMQTQVYGGAS